VIEKIFALFVSTLILGNAMLMRRLVGTWIFPAALFSLFWFGYTFLPLAMLFKLPVNPYGTLYIFALTVAFSLSALLKFRWHHAFAANRLKPVAEAVFGTPFLRAVLFGASCGALALSVANMRVQGFSVQEMLTRTIDTAARYASMRNAEDLTLNWESRLGMVLAYLAVAVGGLVYGSSRSPKQRVSALVASFLPAIASLLFESAKGLLFQFVSLFLGALLVVRLFDGRLDILDRRIVARAALATVLVALLTAVSFRSRGLYGVEDRAVVMAELPRYFASYALGHLYAFSDWFASRLGASSSQLYTDIPSGYGFYTLAPLFKLLGSSRTFVAGVYDEYFIAGDLITTNIYTMFRGLITDFGMTGGIIFMFASGLLIHWAFYKLLKRQRPVTTVAIFIYVVGYFYSSAFISLFMYNVIPASIVILSIVLAVNSRGGWLWRGVAPS
jgi:oligosaccharide repeat unit polymerase